MNELIISFAQFRREHDESSNLNDFGNADFRSNVIASAALKQYWPAPVLAPRET
jgi:hypothetical protein